MSGSDNSGRWSTAAAVASGPANAPNEGPIATTVAAVADGGIGAGAISTAATAVASGWNRRKARFPQRRPPWRMEWDRRAHISKRKIRRDGNRPHRLDTPVPRPIVIGWRGPWLYPWPDFTPR